jgi:energy-coupling factor transporter ATP-binding protein EcfA2
MRLTQIEARNFLSLRQFSLDLDSRNVLVGPNGAGKSNVFRCIDLAVKALAFAQEGGGEAYALLDDYATAANRRSGDETFEVRVGLEFTESWERRLILLFVRAAALTNLLSGRQEPVVPIAVDGQVRKAITAAKIRSLNRGTVVVRYEPGQWPWSIGYAFEHAGAAYTYGVRGAAHSGIVQGDMPPATQQSLGGARLVDRLLPGDANSGSNPGTGDLTHFEMSMLLPLQGEYLDITVQPIPQQGGTPILSEFGQHFPSPINNRIFTIACVLDRIISRSLVMLGDRRGLPKIHYAAEDLQRPPLLVDGSEVPVALWHLQGGSSSERREFGRIKSLFNRLTSERIEIQHAPIVNAPQNPATGAIAPPQQGTLRIEPMVVEGGIDIPVQFAGAGIWEALVLSTVSVDRRGKVLLLDEPASHLHPTLQARFLRELAAARLQSVLITHSTYLVPHQNQSELESVARVLRRSGQSEVRRLPKSAEGHAATQQPRSRWLQILRSADMRSALFANGVVLVEGASDFAALSIWWAKSSTAKRTGVPSDLNIVILESEGEAGFHALTQYLDFFVVPWAIVCDGKAISPTGASALRNRLTAVAADGAPNLDAKFDKWRAWWETRGAFTLAAAADDEIEQFFDRHNEQAWAAAKRQERGRSKSRKARAFAEMTSCPKAADHLYAQILSRLGVD